MYKKKVGAPIIFSTCICLWSVSCLAVKDADILLLGAIEISNFDEAKQAIAKGADIGIRYEGNVTPLDEAIENVDNAKSLPERYAALKIVVLLIEAGAPINGHGMFGWTPLMEAILTNQPDLLLVELLLSYGADPAVESTEDGTAISNAQSSPLEVLELLTSYQVLLQKAKTQPSRTLLLECIEKGRFTLVKLLLQHGIAVTKANYLLAQEKYSETHSMAYEIIGKLIKERLSVTTELGLIAKRGIMGAHAVSHSGERLELTPDIAEHIGSFLPF